MSYSLEYSQRAAKQLAKMDPNVRRTIVAWLRKHVNNSANPRLFGKGLTGGLSGQWRYRIGNYRVLCEIQDDQLVVLALEIGHRSSIYKKH